MMPDDAAPDLTPEEAARVERDGEWAHATMLGEAVWHRIAQRRGLDPKDGANRIAHDEIVSMVRDAAYVIEREGLDGIAEWLELEGLHDA